MMRRMVSGAAVAAALLASPIMAAPAHIPMSDTEQAAPALPPILSARNRAEAENRILAARLDTIIPAIMREEGIDLIGDYLTEINVTCPTGLRAAERLYGINLAARFWDAVSTPGPAL